MFVGGDFSSLPEWECPFLAVSKICWCDSGASPLFLCPESSIVYVQPLCLLVIFTNCLQCSNFYTLFEGSLCVLIAEGNISGISNHGNESFHSQNWCQLH